MLASRGRDDFNAGTRTLAPELGYAVGPVSTSRNVSLHGFVMFKSHAVEMDTAVRTLME